MQQIIRIDCRFTEHRAQKIEVKFFQIERGKNSLLSLHAQLPSMQNNQIYPEWV
jgi:hypothetical protein